MKADNDGVGKDFTFLSIIIVIITIRHYLEICSGPSAVLQFEVYRCVQHYTPVSVVFVSIQLDILTSLICQ